MNPRVIDYDEMKRDVAGIVDDVYSGGTVLLQEAQAQTPAAALISYESYLAVQQYLEELDEVRMAEEALEEYRRDPSTAMSWEDAKAELRDEGLLDGE
jgi:hypothetical protein